MPPLQRIVFFGTPEFAVPTLEALARSGRTPVLVVAQPPRPAGRGRRPQEPPVALWARERGVAVAQPERVHEEGFLERIAQLAPDVAVVVAFGQIFPRRLLELPRLGCINLHASLLPAYRGAAPIQAALAAGEERTGVTTMRMEAGLDTGPVLLQEATPIAPGETAGELSRRLAMLGGDLVVQTLERLEAEALEPRPQDPARATYAPRLTRDSGRVDWSLPAGELAARLNAYTPWPGLAAMLRGAPVKLVAGRALPTATPGAVPVAPGAAVDAAPPGTFLGLEDGEAVIACGGGTRFAVAQLQRPGRRPQRAADFANGERLKRGESFH